MKKTVILLMLLIAVVGCQKKTIPVKGRYTQINIGAPDAGAGDNLYTAFTKVNANFAAVDDSLGLKAPVHNPVFTGVVRIETDTAATRAYVRENGGGGGGQGVWGLITGNLPDQTDLQAALDAKAPIQSPTFAVSATLPAATSIGSVSSTEISHLDNSRSNLQAQLDDTTTMDMAINARTANYTLALQDNYGVVTLSSTSALTLTVPANIFPVGATVTIVATGTGQVTVTGASGVTVNSAGGAMRLRARYSAATLLKTGTNTWLLIGDITT